MPRLPILTVLLLSSLLLAPAVTAQDEAGGTAKAVAEPREFVTQHAIEIDGELLRYTAVAGETHLRNDDGEPRVSFFTISYLKDGVGDPATRPITFLFNGGPGSSAVWLHLGAFGPQRIAFSDDPVNPGAPPYELDANPHTLLDATDLVFVDPVGSGYTDVVGKGKREDYWGLDEDAEAIAELIRTYLTRHRRWSSPKYLAGESYGTIRVSVLVRELQLELLDCVALNGVILISPALDIRSASQVPGNELPFVTFLPSYAAAAYYHDQLPERPADWEQFLHQARDFASGEYLAALFKGDSLPEDEAAAIVERLHRFTGLSEEYLRRTDLRIRSYRFTKELLRARGETMAIHDARFLGQDPDDAGEGVDYDALLHGISGPFVAAINSYLASELGVDFERRYEVFSDAAYRAWKRPRDGKWIYSGSLYTTPYLTEAAAVNKDFRVFVASGYHDLVTPFFAAEYTFDHSQIAKDRITLKNYHAGHMMYLYEPSLAELATDVRTFIAGP